MLVIAMFAFGGGWEGGVVLCLKLKQARAWVYAGLCNFEMFFSGFIFNFIINQHVN